METKIEIHSDHIIVNGVMYIKENYVFKCEISGEHFYTGDEYYWVDTKELGCNGPFTLRMNVSKGVNAAWFHTKESAIEWNAKKFPQVTEKKLICEFEGHKYYKGDKVYFFRKSDYVILEGKIEDIATPFLAENLACSKIFTTIELCEEAREEYVLDNHKSSINDILDIYKHGYSHLSISDYKNLLVKKIIASKQS